ncbi:MULTISPECIES: ATP-dependent helicase [unclassified Bradyrhizobium]|uniref:ATP-dependent helicase n=1 Tax=unclassified Bradyrhizobium TaxID=2631580 RepID=UPI0028E43A8B|nr:MULTISPECIES: ATP-dependent helicase [unclassified Bradyrhizobium]
MTSIDLEIWKPQGVEVLEPRAWEALREVERSVLVTAGAGAGKTEFLAQKAAYLLQTGQCRAPRRILAISFKRDAARNLSNRVVDRCMPDQSRRLNSFTFDAFAKNLLDRFRAAVPEPYRPRPDYQLVFPRRDDWTEFLDRHGFRQLTWSQLETAIARTKLPLDEQPTTQRGRAVLTYWREQYREDDTLLSFSMINRIVEYMLRENPAIQKALQQTFPFVFLDEFQDTTYAQFELLQTAFDGSDANFTAVGDNKQRIMLWAGAMPNAFARFEEHYDARRISLLSNWRSHADLVRIQHAIALRIDPEVEVPDAKGKREVDGDIAAIWDYQTEESEAAGLASWIAEQVAASVVQPHDVAILVRNHVNQIESILAPHFSEHGLRLRNAAREVGNIAIQDLLGEDLTGLVLPLLRLAATDRSPAHWNEALQNLHFLEAIDPADESAQDKLQQKLSQFVRALRKEMRALEPGADAAATLAGRTLEFLAPSAVRQMLPAYRRLADFNRVWEGFVELLQECAEIASDWQSVLDEFEGIGQVALMTIHKSKGLEFHTMIFYGLDNQTWWSLTPDRLEELNSFFVAFTRARQRAFFTLCRERGQPVAWIEKLLAPVDVRRIAK